jgi:hypothetical protein
MLRRLWRWLFHSWTPYSPLSSRPAGSTAGHTDDNTAATVVALYTTYKAYRPPRTIMVAPRNRTQVEAPTAAPQTQAAAITAGASTEVRAMGAAMAAGGVSH